MKILWDKYWDQSISGVKMINQLTTPFNRLHRIRLLE